jgi:hypothetical protein
MENLTISAVLKPVIIGTWFLILAALPFLFPNHNYPLWLSGVFLFFALIILIQLKIYNLTGNEILMKQIILGNTVIIGRDKIEYIAIGDMPKTTGARLGLMKQGRMITVMSKDKTKINIATSSAGQNKFSQAETFLRSNYPEFFKN